MTHLDESELMTPRDVENWLPVGKKAAVCLTVDDVHPGTRHDPYEAGGDLGDGVLGRLQWLLDRHPDLRVTLFVTPDWRLVAPWPTRGWLLRLPWLGRRLHGTRVHPKGRMSLDRHPDFARYLRQLPRTDLAIHGLHHLATGEAMTEEFRHRSVEECRRLLTAAREIFRRAGLEPVSGLAPPRWCLTPDLVRAMLDLEFTFVAASRDVRTPVIAGARNAMSGLQGAALLRPQLLAGRLVHMTVNFQATSPLDRALAVIDHGGLLNIKVHAVKDVCGHVMDDGLDDLYRNYLDAVLRHLADRYGDELWWTSMDEVAGACLAAATEAA